MPARGVRFGTAAAIAAVVAWGGGNVLAKDIALSGLTLAFHRLWLAIIIYLAVLAVAGGRLSVRNVRLAAPSGVAFGLNIALSFSALKLTSVTEFSIIVALQPAVILVVAYRLFGERVTATDVVGTVVATAAVGGVVLGSGGEAPDPLAGNLLSVLALATWTWYFLAAKRARAHLGALEFQTALMTVAFVVVTPLALALGADLALPDLSTMAWVLVIVLGPGTGHLLMNWAHAHTPVVVTSLVTLGVPVVAAALAALLLNEPVTGFQLAAMAVVLVSLGCVLRGSTRRTHLAEPA